MEMSEIIQVIRYKFPTMEMVSKKLQFYLSLK